MSPEYLKEVFTAQRGGMYGARTAVAQSRLKCNLLEAKATGVPWRIVETWFFVARRYLLSDQNG
jgi:hypothetical protein